MNTHHQKSGACDNDGGVIQALIVDPVSQEHNHISRIKRVPHPTVKPARLYAAMCGKKTEASVQIQERRNLQDECSDLQDLTEQQILRGFDWSKKEWSKRSASGRNPCLPRMPGFVRVPSYYQENSDYRFGDDDQEDAQSRIFKKTFGVGNREEKE